MSLKKLSTIDTAFLEIESETAPMHVGFVVTFSPPAGGERPTFEELRDHVAARLAASPRYRQKVIDAPFGAWEPVWIDDPDFDFDRHLCRASSSDLSEVVDSLMSTPLDHGRPLWEMRIAEELDDGRVGLIGKAHHCMVDGLAALELASLLLDTTDEPEPAEPDRWHPAPPPSRRALRRQAAQELGGRLSGAVRALLGLVRSPSSALSRLAWVKPVARAVVDFVRPAPRSVLNRPNSGLRHLARTSHPLDALLGVKRHFDTSLNDVLLAATAGALRRYIERQGKRSPALKAIVPVDLRISQDVSDLGNEMSFMWVDLPVDEPDPVRRLLSISRATSERKAGRRAEAIDAVIGVVGGSPRVVKRAVSHLFASPRTGNLIVSNLVGPPEPLYLRGCEIEEIYPISPLTRRHAVSIGLMSVKGRACFSVYADRVSLPDADLLAEDLDAAIQELGDLVPAGDARAAAEPIPA